MTSWESYKRTMTAAPTLWSAAKENDAATVLRLLGEGHDIDARDPRGYSPLMLAAYSASDEAFEVLLVRGADPNSADLAGNTVLMGAAFKGHLAMVERLLACGADPRAKNLAGVDARGFAAMFGREEVTALLERRGARAPAESWPASHSETRGTHG